MKGYVVGLGIVIVTAIIALSICACFCKIDVCRGSKKEKIPLLNTAIYTGNDGGEIIVSV
jgi:hypothetical protein